MDDFGFALRKGQPTTNVTKNILLISLLKNSGKKTLRSYCTLTRVRLYIDISHVIALNDYSGTHYTLKIPWCMLSYGYTSNLHISKCLSIVN